MNLDENSKKSLINLFESKKSLTIALLRAREALLLSFRPLLAKHNFTEQQWRVLRVLGEKGPCDAGNLAHEACVLAPSLSRIINTLISNKYIEKTIHETDKRKIILKISDYGIEMLEQIKPEYIAVLKSIQKKYGEEKLSNLLNLLAEITTWNGR